MIFGILERKKCFSNYYKKHGHAPTDIFTIPKSVKSIGDEAFRNCNNLTSINILNSVTSIREGAFKDCSSLTNINIPNSITSIGNGAFAGCSSLTNINIPNSVTSIGDEAFIRCSSLTNINIPNSITSIGNGAFRDCSSLTNIDIPNSVTCIGNGAFRDCSSSLNFLQTFRIRNLLPYSHMVASSSSLFMNFDFIFDFLTWQELGRLTIVSKYYYSNILVRCRHMFVNHRIGQSNAEINNDMNVNNLKVTFSFEEQEEEKEEEEVIVRALYSKSIDEMFLYSKDCHAISSISFPASYQSRLDTVANE
jgi:hypothetical protein